GSPGRPDQPPRVPPPAPQPRPSGNRGASQRDGSPESARGREGGAGPRGRGRADRAPAAQPGSAGPGPEGEGQRALRSERPPRGRRAPRAGGATVREGGAH